MATRASMAGFHGKLWPELMVFHDHGKKRGSVEADQTVNSYDVGRGAYYASLVLQGHKRAWEAWLVQTAPINDLKGSVHRFARELNGAGRYVQFLLEDASADEREARNIARIPEGSGVRGGDVHWCRRVMNDRIRAIVMEFPISSMDALEISGDYWGREANWRSYRTAHFPAFDLTRDVIGDEMFDIIFCEQVLEHVKYPRNAAANLFRMLRGGGWLIVTTPFLIQIHDYGGDYSRWTPDGLSCLLQEVGFSAEKISTDAWGNRECIIADLNSCAEGHGWTVYQADIHSLVSEKEYPVVVWAVAQKL
jgi:SAM-dependent methyltransferase